MKKIPCYTLLFFLIIFSTNGIAQKQSKFFVETAAGFAVPVGKFANKTWDAKSQLSNSDGLAKPGFDLNISAGWQANKHLALVIAGGFSTNKQDASSFHNYFGKYINDVQTYINSESWKVFKIMAGTSFNTSLSKKNGLAFRAKILAGKSKTSIPGYNYIATYTNPLNNMPQGQAGNFTKISLPWSFCWQALAGVKYKAGKNFYIFSDAGYLNASLDFHYKYFSPQIGGVYSTSKKIIQSYVSWYGGVGIEL